MSQYFLCFTTFSISLESGIKTRRFSLYLTNFETILFHAWLLIPYLLYIEFVCDVDTWDKLRWCYIRVLCNLYKWGNSFKCICRLHVRRSKLDCDRWNEYHKIYSSSSSKYFQVSSDEISFNAFLAFRAMLGQTINSISKFRRLTAEIFTYC